MKLIMIKEIQETPNILLNWEKEKNEKSVISITLFLKARYSANFNTRKIRTDEINITTGRTRDSPRY